MLPTCRPSTTSSSPEVCQETHLAVATAGRDPGAVGREREVRDGAAVRTDVRCAPVAIEVTRRFPSLPIEAEPPAVGRERDPFALPPWRPMFTPAHPGRGRPQRDRAVPVGEYRERAVG